MKTIIQFGCRKQNVFYPSGFKQFLLAVLILICTCNINSLNAQYLGNIDSLKLLPDNPTQTDTVKVICYITFGSSSCILDSSKLIINNSQITISVNYTIGFESTICNSIDTIVIGKLDTGYYQLNYNVVKENNNPTFYSDSLNFTISSNNSIYEGKSNAYFKISPNPFNTSALLKIDIGYHLNAVLVIYDIMGKEVRRINVVQPETLILRDNLKEGIYLFKIFNDYGYIQCGELIII